MTSFTATTPLLSLLFWLQGVGGTSIQPNPPNWPDSVFIFDPTTENIQDTVNKIYLQNGGHNPPENGQFSEKRFVLMFTPGEYKVDVPVGYYTQVLGLGLKPQDVVFSGDKGVHCEEANYNPSVGALDTFWRAAENFKSTSAHGWWNGANGMIWAVSQAAPLRRAWIVNDLLLFQYVPPYAYAGFSSGGFAADLLVDGVAQSGSQQQFITRNSRVAKWEGANWNMVFVGVEGAPNSHCGKNSQSSNSSRFLKKEKSQNKAAVRGMSSRIDYRPRYRPHSIHTTDSSEGPIISVEETPVIAEKPFLSISSEGKFTLNIPQLRTNVSGPSWQSKKTEEKEEDLVESVDFSKVYVTQPNDTADMINFQLALGLHIVLSPAIYSLEAPLKITHSRQVLLGLGMATLISANGNPCIIVADDLDGVRIAGVLLQAGPKSSPTLLQWGGGSYEGNSSNPGFLYDVFARVGGPDVNEVQAARMVEINSGHVIGDNLWLWRADHTVGGEVYGSKNPCETGMVVEGNDVTMYGLAVEHTLNDLTLWTGERGRCFFYQSEFPYDVDQSYGEKQFVSYRVGDDVKDHDAWALGVYHYFRDYPVNVTSGIHVPENLVERFRAPLSVFLNGQGSVDHVINGHGDRTFSPENQTAYYCS
mmetsp:Transcript_29520/g.48017  ORF Transcript_29520/g.48017 Transcript_29520/m.48017 type:complete len:644 (+) Transcript_29520:71-2002(+)